MKLFNLSLDSILWKLRHITNVTKWSILMLICYVVYLQYTTAIKFNYYTLSSLVVAFILMFVIDFGLSKTYDAMITEKMDMLYETMLNTAWVTNSSVLTLIFNDDLILKNLSACALYKTNNPAKLETEILNIIRQSYFGRFEFVKTVIHPDSLLLVLSNRLVSKADFDSFPVIFNDFRHTITDRCSEYISGIEDINDDFVTNLVNENIQNVITAIVGKDYDKEEYASLYFSVLTLLKFYINNIETDNTEYFLFLKERIDERFEKLSKIVVGKTISGEN